MNVSANRVVTLTYRLTNRVTGETIEETNETNPLVFLYGVGSLIPEFEQNLDGLVANDTFDFAIKAENAYGMPSDANFAVIPLSVFFDEKGEFVAEMFPVGAMIPMSDNDGNHLHGKVLKVDEENITMDFNPPLAGVDLHFTGTVIDVRDASKEEIEHGHVHGAHGHQH